jgi:hypothetical protein
LLIGGAVLALPAAAAAQSPPSLAQELAARFPAVSGRMESEAQFESTTWEHGGRLVAGHRAVFKGGKRSPSPPTQVPHGVAAEPEAVRVSLPEAASDPMVAEGEGVRVVLSPVAAKNAAAEAQGPVLAYRDLYLDTDALHVVQPGWTEEYLHLRSARAPRRFEY